MIPDSERTVYHEAILAHYRRPRHYGLRDGLNCEATYANPACGDAMTVRWNIEQGEITDVCFESSGCVISKAAASFTAEYIKGKPIAVVGAMGVREVTRLMDVTLTPARFSCATLFLEALRTAL